jgi:hypothetical protein
LALAVEIGFYGQDPFKLAQLKEVMTMKRILVDVLKVLGSIVVPIKKPKYMRPKLCQCPKCGQVHYKAVIE